MKYLNERNMKYLNIQTIFGLVSWTRNAVGTAADVGSVVGIQTLLWDLADLVTLVTRGEFPFDDSATTVGLGAALTLGMVDGGIDGEDGSNDRPE